MLIFAHRGYSAKYPENTMISFQKAVEAGCDGIELDVQLTKDHEIVIIHDETLERTTNGKGMVKDCTLQQLKELNASAHFKHPSIQTQIPTLKEYFEYVKDKNIITNIELKNSVVSYQDIEEKVLQLIDEYDLRSQIIISSFNHYSVLKMKQLAPDMKYGFLEESLVLDAAEYAKKYQVDYLHPIYHAVDKNYVLAAKKAGIEINTWTVNEYEDLCRLKELGVHAIISNEIW